MPLLKAPIRPGIIKDDPPLTAEGGFSDGSNVRFRLGRPERVKGWASLSDDTLEGKARAVAVWSANDGETLAAFGTHEKLYLFQGGSAKDITAARATATLTDPFTVTNGSATVEVAHTGHDAIIGDWVFFENASAVGGVTINGWYQIVTAPDNNTYTVTHSAAATSDATGGGSVDLTYQINVGEEYSSVGVGWGVGPWGEEAWDEPRTVGIGTIIRARIWSLAPWGEDLLASPRRGTLYSLDTSVRDSITSAVAAAPDIIERMIVTPDRFCVALGTNEESSGDFNPMLVRWSDQGDYTDWTTAQTNQAGEYALGVGSRIVGAEPSRGQTLIWTDEALFGMRYLGDPILVFGFDQLGTGCGLIGMNAVAELDGAAFWMGSNGQFFMYDGSAPRALECPVQRYVFEGMRQDQGELVFAGINRAHNEIWWFYPTDDDASQEVDRYVAYDYAQNAWHIGDIARTAWADYSALGNPIAVDAAGNLWEHEVNPDRATEDMASYIDFAPFDLGDGDKVASVMRVVPDVSMQNPDGGAHIDVTLYTRRWPQDVIEHEKAHAFSPTDRKIDLRVQGRQVRARIGSDGKTFWRLGDLRMDVREGGRR